MISATLPSHTNANGNAAAVLEFNVIITEDLNHDVVPNTDA
jgi:hypothetical protein